MSVKPGFEVEILNPSGSQSGLLINLIASFSPSHWMCGGLLDCLRLYQSVLPNFGKRLNFFFFFSVSVAKQFQKVRLLNWGPWDMAYSQRPACWLVRGWELKAAPGGKLVPKKRGRVITWPAESLSATPKEGWFRWPQGNRGCRLNPSSVWPPNLVFHRKVDCPWFKGNWDVSAPCMPNNGIPIPWLWEGWLCLKANYSKS